MELKTIKLKGKNYLPVSERLRYFRETHKDGRIVTSVEHLDSKVMFKAEVYIGDKLVATGHGMKDHAKEFELEKCETRSIGRALAIAGISLENGIASYDEIADFHRSELDSVKNEAPKDTGVKKTNSFIPNANQDQIDTIMRLCEETGDEVSKLYEAYKVPNLMGLTEKQARMVIERLEEKLKEGED